MKTPSHRPNFADNGVINEVIHGAIVSAHNKRISHYKATFGQQCRWYACRLLDVPFTLSVTFYGSALPDIDFCVETLLDCLIEYYAITKASHCIKVVAEKREDPKRPRTVFSLIPVSGYHY